MNWVDCVIQLNCTERGTKWKAQTTNHSWSGNSKTNRRTGKKNSNKQRTSQPNRIKSSLTKRYSVATWETKTHQHTRAWTGACQIGSRTMFYPIKVYCVALTMTTTTTMAHKQFPLTISHVDESSMPLFPTCTSHVSGFNVFTHFTDVTICRRLLFFVKIVCGQ